VYPKASLVIITEKPRTQDFGTITGKARLNLFYQKALIAPFKNPSWSTREALTFDCKNREISGIKPSQTTPFSLPLVQKLKLVISPIFE